MRKSDIVTGPSIQGFVDVLTWTRGLRNPVLLFAAFVFSFAAACDAQSIASPNPLIVEPLKGPFRIPSVAMERAFSVFRNVCLKTFPEPRAFNAAVEASGLGFRRDTTVGSGMHSWRDRHRYLILSTDDRTQDGRVMQSCAFRVAISEQTTTGELIDAIGQTLAPGRPRQIMVGPAYWDLDDGDFSYRLEYLPVSEEVRFFELKLRRIGSGPEI